MFAETPEDVRQSEQQKEKQQQQQAGIHRRGLIDAYDDAEGYYNFQVGEVIGDHYKVFKAHGRGVFSSVLRARDLSASSSTSPTSPPPK